VQCAAEAEDLSDHRQVVKTLLILIFHLSVGGMRNNCYLCSQIQLIVL